MLPFITNVIYISNLYYSISFVNILYLVGNACPPNQYTVPTLLTQGTLVTQYIHTSVSVTASQYLLHIVSFLISTKDAHSIHFLSRGAMSNKRGLQNVGLKYGWCVCPSCYRYNKVGSLWLDNSSKQNKCYNRQWIVVSFMMLPG